MSSGETKHDRLLKFIAGEKVDTFYLETIFFKAKHARLLMFIAGEKVDTLYCKSLFYYF